MLIHACDACGHEIKQKLLVELTARVLKTDEPSTEGSQVEDVIGDYCTHCLDNGKALADLLAGCKKLK